jgi:hypothetical protein
MSRVEAFYKKFNIETPEEKKEREAEELKAKKKEARRIKKQLKEEAAKEAEYISGIKQDREGRMLIDLAKQREDDSTPAEQIEEYIAAHNLPIVNNWVPCTPEFIKFVEQGGYNKGFEAAKAELNQNAEENEEMNIEQAKDLIKVVLEEVKGADLKLQEARNRELELKLAIMEAELKLEMARMNPLTGKVEEVSVEGKVEEVVENPVAHVEAQFTEKPKRRVGRPRKVVSPTIEELSEFGSSVPLVSPDVFTKLIEDGLSHVPKDAPIPAEYFTHRGIDWKRIKEEGKFVSMIAEIVKHAAAHGVNVANGKEFKEFSKVTNGAYQQYAMENKGVKGAWKALITEIGVQA